MKHTILSAAPSQSLDRRSFLRLTVLAGGGFALGYSSLKAAGAAVTVADAATVAAEFAPNGFIRIATNGTVTLFSNRPEIGQGIKTALPLILAEELDVEWKDVTVVSEPLDSTGSLQGASGSTSVPTDYARLRQLGATARAMLVEAAAQTWGVPASECSTVPGAVVHAGSGKKLSYGALASKAATLQPPTDVSLKDPKKFRILGTRVPGADNAAIVTGKPLFGVDTKIPGMLHAVYQKCPVFGGTPLSANLDEVKKLPGVKDAFIIAAGNGPTAGVAIVADTTWAAFSARDKLKVVWDEGARANDSWADMSRQAKELGAQAVANDAPAFTSAAKVIEANYSFPYISHATMEPQNCTVRVDGDRAEVWVPTQQPGQVRSSAAQALGINQNQVTVHVTRAGGGFGRRLQTDYASEAAAIAKRVNAPVKLTWTREDDLTHDYFRPAGFNFLRGALDAAGKLIAWRNFTVGFAAGGGGRGRGGPGGAQALPVGGGNTVFGQVAPPPAGAAAPAFVPGGRGGAPGGARGGGGRGGFPGSFVATVANSNGNVISAVPTGAWRAPGDCTSAWVDQSFLDELAQASGRDPLDFKLDLLNAGQAGAFKDRTLGVVKLAAEKAGWGKKLPKGQGMGLAFHSCHAGYVAHVAEVTVAKTGEYKVTRVVAAVDVGSQILNLSSAENQVEGAIVDGLSAAGFQSLNLEKGRIVEKNFDEYPMLRMAASPVKIEVHFLLSSNSPTGLGEPALPPLAPAVCNAIFAAIGTRIRSLPFSATSLKGS